MGSLPAGAPPQMVEGGVVRDTEQPAFRVGNRAALVQRLGTGELSGRVLEVLIRNHRINNLGSIVEALAEMIRRATGTLAAEVRAAHQLTPDEQASLARTLEAKFGSKVEVTVTTDPTLLGGFVAKVGSEVFDASVAGKINRFRESLM